MMGSVLTSGLAGKDVQLDVDTGVDKFLAQGALRRPRLMVPWAGGVGCDHGDELSRMASRGAN